MKLLLTSYGITNDSIANTLNDLVGKESKDIKIAFIPTGAHGSRGNKKWLIEQLNYFLKYNYQVDVVEITAHEPDVIKSAMENSDVIFLGGGNCFYLSYWMQKRGLFDYLPELLGTKVLAGLSAGSMLAGVNLRMSSQALDYTGDLTDEALDTLGPAGESSAKTLHLVDFVFKPHFNSPEKYEFRNEEYIRSVANRTNKPIYAIDDQSALKIVDSCIEVISHTNWLLLNTNETTQ